MSGRLKPLQTLQETRLPDPVQELNPEIRNEPKPVLLLPPARLFNPRKFEVYPDGRARVGERFAETPSGVSEITLGTAASDGVS